MMIFKELECGFFEGIPEESDHQIDDQTFKDLAKALYDSSPDLLKDLVTQGFQSLSEQDSEKFQDVLRSMLDEN